MIRLRLLSIGLLVAAAVATTAPLARAQTAAGAAQDTVTRPSVPRIELLGGLHLGMPAGASVAVGPVYTYQEDRHDRSRFWFAFAEPGIRAGRVSVGHGRWTSNLGTAWTVRTSYLQLWRESSDRYAGVEVSALGFALGLRLGAFAALQDNSPKWRFSADFAIML